MRLLFIALITCAVQPLWAERLLANGIDRLVVVTGVVIVGNDVFDRY